MKRIPMVVVLALAVVGVPQAARAQQGARDTVVVKLVDKSASSFAFEPSHLTVHPGEVVRFVQTAAIPHNVAFTKVPGKAKLGARKSGPFLTRPGQTYDLAIDSGFVPGHYDFVCLPHMALGMTGTLDVKAGASTQSQR